MVDFETKPFDGSLYVFPPLLILRSGSDMVCFRYEVPAADDPDNVIVAVYLREKKSSLTYSPSNLFGQPLLVGVPAADTNYEQLYEIVLKSLSR